MEQLDLSILTLLGKYDTPTICNALDLAAPDRPRDQGFTRRSMIALDPDLPPIVGFARTAKICATKEVSAEEKRELALKYYAYTAESKVPIIIAVEDTDPEPGLGAHWGEVHTHLHQGLGAVGAITNGAIRDLDDCADNFQIIAGSVSPSHAYMHVVEVGNKVNIFGMPVEHNDLIHADKHGAVVIPEHAIEFLPGAIDTILKREKKILDAVKEPGFNIESLTKAVNQAADIH